MWLPPEENQMAQKWLSEINRKEIYKIQIIAIKDFILIFNYFEIDLLFSIPLFGIFPIIKVYLIDAKHKYLNQNEILF
jgi:hypothetical protein